MSRYGDCPTCGRGLWCVSTVHRNSATPDVTVSTVVEPLTVVETTVTYECRDVTGTWPSACGYRREKRFTRQVPQTLEELHGMSRKDRRELTV